MGADLQVLRHPHQIRQRLGMHFAHDAPAMNLDRVLGYVQFGRNLLVKEPGNHLLHDFLLAQSATDTDFATPASRRAAGGFADRVRWPPEWPVRDPVHRTAWSETQPLPLSLPARRLGYCHGP